MAQCKHADVYLSLHLDNKTKDIAWRLNTSLLNYPQCKKYIEQELKITVEYNDNEEKSPCTLWDAAKAVSRGSIERKEKQKQLKDLLDK